jgi:site-specific DNA-methyltransferase (cytosine-N4-specific)
MQEIINKIQFKTELNSDYWDFKDKNSLDSFALSNVMKYPAMMVSDMQKELIGIIASATTVGHMLDPFCGSGVTLVESLKHDIQPYGIDINPLAYLLVTVKSTNYSLTTLNKILEYLLEAFDQDFEYPIHDFNGIDKWFRHDIKKSLSRIRHIITGIDDLKVRRFLWVVFADTVRDSCNSRTSTYKLYIRESRQIENLPSDIEKIFLGKVREIVNEFVRFQSNGTSNKRVKVYYGDVLEILRDRRRFKDGCVDLICTSPPYGDNGTTITYGQFSILQLRWIDIKDIEKKIDYKIIETQNAIDRMSLGGRSYSISTIENSGLFEKSKTSKEMHDFLVKQRREDKARKVSSFLIDYDKYFEQSVRVLRDGGYQVITLGNRTVHNKVISFDQITIELAEYYGLQYIWSFQRNIRNKRRPKTVNRDNTQTINQETIIILRKEE